MLSSNLFDTQEKESWDMSAPEKIETAIKLKEDGNALFKSAKYTRACKKYEKVRSTIRPICTFLALSLYWKLNLLESWDMHIEICRRNLGSNSKCPLCSVQASKLIEYESGFDDEQKKKCKVLKVSCNLNNAACKLKVKDYKEVIKLATKVSLSQINMKHLQFSKSPKAC